MSPGPQKLLQNVIFPRLGSSIFRFFSFSAELWFRTTLPWFCCFFGFRVSLFRCRRYPKPDKTHSCCSGGSEPHFQHAFSENPSKNDIKMEVLFRTGLNQFSTILRHRSLFTPFWPKLPWKHQKGHPNDTIFINFLVQSLQKRWLNDPGSSRMMHSWKRLLQ